ncbi:tetratricopeptide repeat protein, partial [candidate division KSB1 bacterium]|nr:tetratricopeptide repeat protein [candidate division KSB1 bacterium]
AVELKPKFKDKGVKISKDSGTEFHAQFGTEMILKIVWGKIFNEGVKYFNDALNAPDDSLKQSNFEQAAEAFKAAGTIAPDSVLAWQNMASAYMSMSKYEESIEPLKIALEHNPKDSNLKTTLAQVYMRSGKDSLAMPMFEELWADGVHNAEVADYLARGYIKAEDIEAAKNVYKQALEVNPDNFNFRYNYGTILLENQEHDEAIVQLLKAAEIDPEKNDINYNLGAAYLNRGVSKREDLPEDSQDKTYKEDFKLALPYLEKAIRMNPDDSNTWFTLGRIAGQLNKIPLSGYAFAKGEPTKSVLDSKVVIGMQGSALKMILGEPNQINSLESEQFETVMEWVYKTRRGTKGKVAIPEPISVYVMGERVDALLIIK